MNKPLPPWPRPPAPTGSALRDYVDELRFRVLPARFRALEERVGPLRLYYYSNETLFWNVVRKHDATLFAHCAMKLVRHELFARRILVCEDLERAAWENLRAYWTARFPGEATEG